MVLIVKNHVFRSKVGNGFFRSRTCRFLPSIRWTLHHLRGHKATRLQRLVMSYYRHPHGVGQRVAGIPTARRNALYAGFLRGCA